MFSSPMPRPPRPSSSSSPRPGIEGLREIMNRMATSTDKGASEAIKEVLGLTFQEFESEWKEFLASKGLKEVSGVECAPLQDKGGKGRRGTHGHGGDQIDGGQEPGPSGRSAQGEGKDGGGGPGVSPGPGGNPGFRPHHEQAFRRPDRPGPGRGGPGAFEAGQGAFSRPSHHLHPSGPDLFEAQGFQGSERGFSESIQINPFNPEVHQGLATAYEMLGDEDRCRSKEREIAKRT